MASRLELDSETLRKPIHVGVIASNLASVEDVGILETHLAEGLEIFFAHVPGFASQL
jgi:hypothetical protein